MNGSSGELEAMVSGNREMDLARACRLWRLLLALGKTEEMRRILDILETRSRISGVKAEEAEACLNRQWPLVKELAALEEPLTARYPDYAALASRITAIENAMQPALRPRFASRGSKKPSFRIRLKGQPP